MGAQFAGLVRLKGRSGLSQVWGVGAWLRASMWVLLLEVTGMVFTQRRACAQMHLVPAARVGVHLRAALDPPHKHAHDRPSPSLLPLLVQLQRLGSSADGALFTWQLPQQRHTGMQGWGAREGPTSFAVLASGLKPCDGLRVWVARESAFQRNELQQEQQEQQEQQQEGGSGGVQVEVTHLAAWLPPVVASARRHVRDWG